MKSKYTRRWSAVVACAIALGGLTVATPAVAAPPAQADKYVEVPMQSVAITEESVTANGFEVVTDQQGKKFAVAAGTATGDLSAAVAIPEPGGVTTMGSVPGNCGKSWVYFVSKKNIRTGYTIFASKGSPVSQTWNVAVKSTTDFQSYGFTGLATWGSQTWQAYRAIDVDVLVGGILSAVAGGSVLTSTTLCTSGSPTALYYN